MSRQIIRKDDGTIAVWSTVVDDFVYEGPMADYIRRRRRQAANDAEQDIIEIMEQLERGERPYAQFTMTYAEAFAKRRALHRVDKDD